MIGKKIRLKRGSRFFYGNTSWYAEAYDTGIVIDCASWGYWIIKLDEPQEYEGEDGWVWQYIVYAGENTFEIE